jgi:exonuclease SbcC
MKPVLIQMQAFGPFASLQVVDFSLLGSKTFFLIHGPTGSGKTTILDAMCFALFGDSSGGERDGRQMRSHHADAETLTQVTFDFLLGGQTYRVHRIPDQMRKARRGGGETRQAQVAELFRRDVLDGKVVERAVESGWGKVTAAVEKLLGFESRQFRQVIMLPQGKFFEFLKSSSQDREKILQVLFGTELYKRIEEQLSRSAAEVSQKAATLNTQRLTLLAQAHAADDAALEAQLVHRAEALAVSGKAVQDTAGAAQRAEAQLAQARKLADRFEELDKAAGALQALKAQELDCARRRTQLGRARQAASVQPHVDTVQGLEKQLLLERAKLEGLRSEAQTAAKAQAAAQQAVDRERLRTPELERAIGQLARLQALDGKVLALEAARKELTAAKAAQTQRQAEYAKAMKDFKDANEAQQRLTAEVQAHLLLVAGQEGLRANQARLAQQSGHAIQLAKATAEAAKAKRQTETQAAAVKAAQEGSRAAHLSKEQVHCAWIAGQAASLAQGLAAGQPCPVCGAHEHPAPAHQDREVVHDETLKAAEDALAQAEAALRAAEGVLAECQMRQFSVETLAGTLQAALADVQDSAEELKTKCESASAALKQAEAAAGALKPLQDRLTQAAPDLATLEALCQSASTRATDALGRQHQSEAVFKEREADIPAELADTAKLKAAQSAAQSARDAIKRAHDQAVEMANEANAAVARLLGLTQGSEQTEAAIKTQLAGKTADLDERLRAAAFGDVDACRAAWLADEQVLALDSGIQAFDANRAAASQRHERASVETRDLVRPDVVAATGQHEAAKAAHIAASNAVRDAVAAHDTVKALAESLRRLAVDHQAQQARYALVKKVADVAIGENKQRMSFQRYVLATLLEEVLVATTLRLRVMSRGRYEIRRQLQATDLRSAAGLDLEVFDQYTGMTRAVTTLSGGESFLASLALALGLSDVVQSYAGGIRLDAIFVDEGFGTLDPEALDFAVRALKDLQQAGRLVGIISHVAELREWIDARLELKAGQAGSVAEFVV